MPQKVMRGLSQMLLLCMATSLSPLLPIWAFSQGAKPSSCLNMEPGHIRAHSQDPHHSHVTLQTAAHSYRPGNTLSVVVRSTKDFMGFLLQARTVREDRIVGTFVLVPPGSRTLGCVDAEDTVTHSDKLLKRNLSFIWRAPDRPLGDVRFFITVVQSYFVYWARIQSDLVNDGTENSIPYFGEEDSTGAEPEFWMETANWSSSVPTAEPKGRSQQRAEDNDIEPSTLPAISRGSPTTLASRIGSAPFNRSLDQAQTTATSQKPSDEPQSCLHCKKISIQSGPEDPSPPLSSGQTPEEPQPSSQTDPDHQTELTSSLPHLDRPPAPRRSHLDLARAPVPEGRTTPRQTPPPRTRVLPKGVVARNLSRGGDTGPSRESGAGAKGEGPPGGGGFRRSGLEVGVLLGCSAGLGMALAVGLRYLHSQYCLKRTAVSLSEHDGNIIHVQDSGELVQIRKIRQNSFVLLQAEYNVMTPPGN